MERTGWWIKSREISGTWTTTPSAPQGSFATSSFLGAATPPGREGRSRSRHLRRRLLRRTAIEFFLKPLLIERAIPSGNNDSGNPVSDHIGDCPRHRHEAFNAEQQRHSCNRNSLNTRQGRTKRYER